MERGIKNNKQIKKYNEMGVFNFLIGESILRSSNYEIFINELLNNG